MISPSQYIDSSSLHLATTIFFLLILPDDPLTYPRVLIHRCAAFTGTGIDKDRPALQRFLGCSYWNYGNFINFKFEAQNIVSLSEAIKLCGLDPKSANREDMEKQNPIFECLACNGVRKGRCTLSWLGLVCYLFFPWYRCFSHQYVHLQDHYYQEGWDDLNLELLGDEDSEASRVMDRNAETLSY